MIKFTLSCDNGHRFESWFASSAAFDSLSASGMISCMDCSSTKISKSLMAPAVATSERRKPIASEQAEKERALAELRKQVEDNADYVGLSFATEARAMHLGDKPERAIYGEANLQEAKSLIEDGIPVAPLPFLPKRKANLPESRLPLAVAPTKKPRRQMRGLHVHTCDEIRRHLGGLP